MYKILFIAILFLSTWSNLFAETISKINIKGNNRISSETIKIYGNLKNNRDYTESDLNEILRNLYQTDFFEDVNVEIQNNILNVVVKEYPFINQLIIFGEKTENYKKQIKKLLI